MKKAAKSKRDADMLDEYDFSSGVRGKYAKRYAGGTNVVVLDADVAAVFPNALSVNKALRAHANRTHERKEGQTLKK